MKTDNVIGFGTNNIIQFYTYYDVYYTDLKKNITIPGPRCKTLDAAQKTIATLKTEFELLRDDISNEGIFEIFGVVVHDGKEKVKLCVHTEKKI